MCDDRIMADVFKIDYPKYDVKLFVVVSHLRLLEGAVYPETAVLPGLNHFIHRTQNAK